VNSIADIEYSDVIEKILTHLDKKGAVAEAFRLPPCRASPQASLFDGAGYPVNHSHGCDAERRSFGAG
jgi:hypothetical protein